MLLQVASTIDSAGYRIGYTIGQWGPFAVLAISIPMMIILLRRRKKKEGGS
jgi:hypothetical protein